MALPGSHTDCSHDHKPLPNIRLAWFGLKATLIEANVLKVFVVFYCVQNNKQTKLTSKMKKTNVYAGIRFWML